VQTNSEGRGGTWKSLFISLFHTWSEKFDGPRKSNNWTLLIAIVVVSYGLSRIYTDDRVGDISAGR
jgi:hypothetical protein